MPVFRRWRRRSRSGSREVSDWPRAVWLICDGRPNLPIRSALSHGSAGEPPSASLLQREPQAYPTPPLSLALTDDETREPYGDVSYSTSHVQEPAFAPDPGEARKRRI
jgi:hypothetical protein